MGTKPYLLLENSFKNLTCNADNIVLEIGSERGEGSSEWLHNWAKGRGMEFHSVDVLADAKNSAANHDIQFHVHESGSSWCREVLPLLGKKIKVLYLDNFDWIADSWTQNPPDFLVNQIEEYASRGVSMNNANSQQEHLLQAKYCLPFMDEESIIIVDDTYYDLATETWGGKCGLVMPWLEQHGYELQGDPVFGKWACRNYSD